MIKRRLSLLQLSDRLSAAGKGSQLYTVAADAEATSDGDVQWQDCRAICRAMTWSIMMNDLCMFMLHVTNMIYLINCLLSLIIDVTWNQVIYYQMFMIIYDVWLLML